MITKNPAIMSNLVFTATIVLIVLWAIGCYAIGIQTIGLILVVIAIVGLLLIFVPVKIKLIF
jgi:hypothetical protein